MRSGRARALAIGCLVLCTAPPAPALNYVDASSGLPATHVDECNPPTSRVCNNSMAGGGWVGVALGDVDGNGFDDVAAVGRLLRRFRVWLSDGAGNWTDSSLGLETSCHGRSEVELRDVNGDGRRDFGGIRGINGLPGVWLGNGAGGWTASSSGLDSGGGEGFTFGDFDGDGRLDLATGGHFAGGVHAFFGDGQGSFIERSAGLPLDPGGHKIAAGDFDGDGAEEIIDTLFGLLGPDPPGGSGVHIWRFGAGVWSLVHAQSFNQPAGIAVADLDGDGRLDFVSASAQETSGARGSVRAFFGDGQFGFTERSDGLPVLEVLHTDVALGDLDNDGDPDIVAGDRDGNVRLFRNDGPGPWEEEDSVGLPSGADFIESLALGDADGDCRLDVAVAAYSCGVHVYRQADPVPCPILTEAGPPRTVCAGATLTLDGAATRLCGCAAGNERFRWFKDGVLIRDWSPERSLVDTPTAAALYRLEAACSATLPPACSVGDTVLVSVSPDAIPPAFGNSLKQVKELPDGIRFAWTAAASGTWGDDQVLALPAALGPPTQAAFDGPLSLVVATAPPATGVALDGDGLTAPAGAVFHRVRATSACAGTPGPA